MNLCVVESPFQLLSAYEASLSFSDCKTLFVVKYNHEKINCEQMKSLVSLFGIEDDVIEVSSSLFASFANIKLLWMLKRLSACYKFKRVFIGEYRSFYMRKYLDFFDTADSYCLDDGNISYKVAEYIEQGVDQYYFSGLKGVVKSIVFFVLDIPFRAFKIKVNRDIGLFTCFDIDKSFVIRHHFDKVKEVYSRHASRKVILFYGTNLSVAGVSYELEKQLLTQAVKYLSSDKIQIIYYPHRRETQEKIDYITSGLGLTVVQPEYPAEIEMLVSGLTPETIASFGSSVLATLPLINNEIKKVLAFYPSDSLIPEKYLDEWSAVKLAYKDICEIIQL